MIVIPFFCVPAEWAKKPFDKVDFVNLLYYLGNLTLKGKTAAGKTLFQIPNYVIGDLYWQFYGYVIQERRFSMFLN
jgi:hypothetical protein